MNRVLVIALSSVLCAGAAAVPLELAAAKAPGKAAAAYRAPRNSFGQPDLTGYWSNVSMTPETRPAGVVGAAYPLDKAHAIEAADAHVAELENKPIDPHQGAPEVGGSKPCPAPGRSSWPRAGAPAAMTAAGWTPARASCA